VLVADADQERGVLQQTGHLGERGAVDDGLHQRLAGFAQLAGEDPAEGALLDQLLVAEGTGLDTRDASQPLVSLVPVTGHRNGAASGDSPKKTQAATSASAMTIAIASNALRR